MVCQEPVQVPVHKRKYDQVKLLFSTERGASAVTIQEGIAILLHIQHKCETVRHPFLFVSAKRLDRAVTAAQRHNHRHAVRGPISTPPDCTVECRVLKVARLNLGERWD